MGRDAAVTYEQVRAAAETIVANGTKPAARLIRQMLGNVGSMGTISKFLQQWRASQQDQPVSVRMLPPVLQQVILSFADEEAARCRTQIAAELVDCRQELADLAEENEKQVEIVGRQRDQIENLTTEKSVMDGRLAQLHAELTAARNDVIEERRQAELARTEVAKMQLRLDALASLPDDLRQARADLEAQRQACVRAEQTAAVLDAQKSELERRLAEIKDELIESRATGARIEQPMGELAGLGKGKHHGRAVAEQESSGLTAAPEKPGRKSNGSIEKPNRPQQQDLL